jgi:electron transfer flavoprotein beta subunit
VGAAALRVDWPEPEYLAGLAADEQPLAAALAAAIRPASPVLVLCGDRSADRGTGALPAFLAQELGVPQALGLVSLTWPDSPGAGMGDRPGALTGERRLPGGWRERLSIALPAVCSVEAAGIRLRRAPLDAVLAARRADLPVVIPDARAGHLLQVGPARPYRPRTHQVPAAPAGSARERLAELSGVLTQRDPPALIGPADPARAAEALLGYLRRNGFAQDAPVPDDKSSTDQPSPAGQGSPPDGGSSPDHGSPPEEVGSPDQASPPDPASPPDQASPPEPAGVNDAAGGQPADSRSARPPGPG